VKRRTNRENADVLSRSGAAAIQIGKGLTDAPVGSLRNVYLVVTGLDPARGDYASFADFSDPDGNRWVLQERGYRS
jgi:hypothetical protein